MKGHNNRKYQSKNQCFHVWGDDYFLFGLKLVSEVESSKIIFSVNGIVLKVIFK